MNAGFVGLGKMGGNMVRRCIGGGHRIVAFDPNEKARAVVQAEGAAAVESLEGLAELLPAPRLVWVMVPAGKVTGKVLEDLSSILQEGDILVDGGNSHYRNSQERAGSLGGKGLRFLDVGTSGGIWGLETGYCMMIGGEEKDFAAAEPIIKTLAPDGGYAHVGPSGAGHFVKMVHNAIEYAMLEAYGEGFEIMAAKEEFRLDLEKISDLWNHGSVIRSWLLELAVLAFRKDPRLEKVKGYVEDTGEGRWSVQDAIDGSIPAPAITLSLLQRFRSRQEESFSAKMIAALRNEFGGHGIKRA